jgi:hypothetical protein
LNIQFVSGRSFASCVAIPLGGTLTHWEYAAGTRSLRMSLHSGCQGSLERANAGFSLLRNTAFKDCATLRFGPEWGNALGWKSKNMPRPNGQRCESFLSEELLRFGPKAHPFR